MGILNMVLHLAPKGVLVGGPPCQSWIWINRSTSGRTRDQIFGNTARSYVSHANTPLACMIEAQRNCHFAICILIAACRGAMAFCSFDLLWSCTWAVRITARFILLAMVAVVRGCHLLVEQPSGSIMLDFPYWRFFALMIAPVAWGQVRLSLPQLSSHLKRVTYAAFGCVQS